MKEFLRIPELLRPNRFLTDALRWCGPGRPMKDRENIFRAFIMKAVLHSCRKKEPEVRQKKKRGRRSKAEREVMLKAELAEIQTRRLALQGGSEAGIMQHRIQHEEILLFDEADRIKVRFSGEKTNEMSAFSVEET